MTRAATYSRVASSSRPSDSRMVSILFTTKNSLAEHSSRANSIMCAYHAFSKFVCLCPDTQALQRQLQALAPARQALHKARVDALDALEDGRLLGRAQLGVVQQVDDGIHRVQQSFNLVSQRLFTCTSVELLSSCSSAVLPADHQLNQVFHSTPSLRGVLIFLCKQHAQGREMMSTLLSRAKPT